MYFFGLKPGNPECRACLKTWVEPVPQWGRALILLTLAGDELPVTVDPTAHVSLQSFENAVLERLPHLGSKTTLGCELEFAQTNTLQILVDPTQHARSTNHRCCVIAPQCMVEAVHKGQLKGEVKAIRLPRGRNDKISPQAFSFCAEIRYASLRAVSRLLERLRGRAVDSCKLSTCQTQSSAHCMAPLAIVPRLQAFRH